MNFKLTFNKKNCQSITKCSVITLQILELRMEMKAKNNAKRKKTFWMAEKNRENITDRLNKDKKT
jgi:hypothetical protein